jgi:hypothetical protein
MVTALLAPVSRPRICRLRLVPSLKIEAFTRMPSALILVATFSRVSVASSVTLPVLPPIVKSMVPVWPSAVVPRA